MQTSKTDNANILKIYNKMKIGDEYWEKKKIFINTLLHFLEPQPCKFGSSSLLVSD